METKKHKVPEFQVYLDETRRGSEPRPLTEGVPVVNDEGYRWEMDCDGNHRIVSPDGLGGAWSWYRGPAISADGKYMAFSSYYAGDLPAERLVAIFFEHDCFKNEVVVVENGKVILRRATC